jgi:glucokinase
MRGPTPRGAGSLPLLIDQIVQVATDLGASGQLGVGVPGLVNRDGVLRAAPNLDGVRDFPVRRLVSERLGLAPYVDSDGTCTALAEWRLGAGRGSRDMISITLGTGIGGGMVVDGRLRRGSNGYAGEFGHMLVDPHGPPCPCGRFGCWERYASGSGLAMLAKRDAIGGRLDAVVARAGGVAEDVRGEHVVAAARDGDDRALAVIGEFARWVAIGLANLTNAFDPELFVLGGGMAGGADLYAEPVRVAFREVLFQSDRRELPSIESAELGERAGAIGAALLSGV